MSGTTSQDWFLTNAEARLQPAHTSGNKVSALVDGQVYMDRLNARVTALASDGYVHLAGWRLTPQVRLLADASGAPSIRQIVTDRSNADLTIRTLLWFVPGTIGDFGASHGQENLDMTQLVEDLGEEGVLDDRLPGGTFASHHHKFVVMGDAAGGDVAFIGGIDIALDRWDSAQHNDPAGRQRELFDGWHDVQAQLEGPAVAQLWDSFAERWNDPRRPHGMPFTAGGSRPAAIPASQRPVPPADTGTCHVQVVHTYPCKSRDLGFGDSDQYPFAPNGDRSYEAALVKAINAAEHFVYVEDQYLWPCRVVDALVAAAARDVSVILVLTNNYDVEGLKPYHNFLRKTCVDQIRAANERRLFVFHLQQDSGSGAQDIYVHAKTVVIDDRYAIIGTANINRRSMTTDTEIGVAIVDSDLLDARVGGRLISVCRFAHEYRMQLWNEHLGTPIEDPLNNDGTPRGWPTSPNERVHHVRVHQQQMPCHCRPWFIPFVFMNPETICP